MINYIMYVTILQIVQNKTESGYRGIVFTNFGCKDAQTYRPTGTISMSLCHLTAGNKNREGGLGDCFSVKKNIS